MTASGEALAIAGVRLGTACAEIRQSDRDDLVVVLLDEGATLAGVFTQSAFRAPPVVLAEARQLGGRALVINSGNANAATGTAGERDADEVCHAVAEHVGLPIASVLPFSTGVIGERLPVQAMRVRCVDAMQRLRPDGWSAAARAIMTTDTVPKVTSGRGEVGGKSVAVTGIAKGSGMIKPDMATMLAFMATDAAVPQPLLADLVKAAADVSFNRVTVDGDTSTNDAFVLMATGKSGCVVDDPASAAYRDLAALVAEHAQRLAKMIARDGEGASKFVTVEVRGGATSADCLAVAYTIAESPLVKTAIFAGDPNWGRFCMAIGRAGVPVDPDRVDVDIDGVPIARGGMVARDYDEDKAAAAMSGDALTVRVNLNAGTAAEWVWTCDLSYDYVRINAEYRT